jgi:hypothetical protein
LSVQPFASLIGCVFPNCPRLLINSEKCGMDLPNGFLFDQPHNTRDVFVQASCDDGVAELKKLILDS